MDKIAKARGLLLQQYPWYGYFSSQMNWKEEKNPKMWHGGRFKPTMGVSVNSFGDITCHYFPEFVEKLSLIELSCVIIHEIDHIVRLHCLRMASKHPMLWNIATDSVVNGPKEDPNIKIIKPGTSVPQCYFPNPNDCIWYFAPEPNWTSEQVYEYLRKNAKKCPTCGSLTFDMHCQGEGGEGEGDKKGKSKGKGKGKGKDKEKKDKEGGGEKGEEEKRRWDLSRLWI